MLRTGLLYSDEYLRHKNGALHPEKPDRVSHVYRHLQAKPLFDRLRPYEPVSCPFQWIEEIHAPGYIDRVKNACLSGEAIIDSLDTGISHDSFEVARLAAGGTLKLIDAVMDREIDNGFALIRPPGHHAEKDIALGFCLFNNVAIAARYIQKKYNLKKVLIIDWDVHHGNGTQSAFYDDPTVYYFSVHQYPYYPGTGAADERGRGEGLDTTLNIPLPAHCGDAEYIESFKKRFLPKAAAFSPDFILISAGFDAHQNDPLGHMNVTKEGFRKMSAIVKGLAEKVCHGRIVSLLEGGYDLDGLAESVETHLSVLNEAAANKKKVRTARSKKRSRS